MNEGMTLEDDYREVQERMARSRKHVRTLLAEYDSAMGEIREAKARIHSLEIKTADINAAICASNNSTTEVEHVDQLPDPPDPRRLLMTASDGWEAARQACLDLLNVPVNPQAPEALGLVTAYHRIAGMDRQSLRSNR